MKSKIPKTVFSVLAVLVCLNVGTLMAQHQYEYIRTYEWCCVEEPVQEECPPEETVSPPPPQLEKPEPIAPIVVPEPIPEPPPPEPVVFMPEPEPEVVVIVPAPEPEPAPLEKPLPATASNWLTDLLVGFTMIGLAFGLRRRCAT